MDAIRVMLADDHPIMGAGMHILGEARRLFEDLAPDILFIEMTLADEPEPQMTECAQSVPSAPQVFVLRGCHNCEYVFGVLSSGSSTMLTERDALRLIAEAIRAEVSTDAREDRLPIATKTPPPQLEDTAETMPDLTTREIEVLRQLIAGKSDQAISQHLCISKRTVRYHLQNIYTKLGVQRRSEAIVRAVRAGLGEP